SGCPPRLSVHSTDGNFQTSRRNATGRCPAGLRIRTTSAASGVPAPSMTRSIVAGPVESLSRRRSRLHIRVRYHSPRRRGTIGPMAAPDLIQAAQEAARAGDARRARDLYRSALAADPNAAGAAHALDDLEAGDEAARELALCEQTLAAVGEPGAAGALHLRAAQLWLGRTPPRLERAITHLQRAFALDPDDDDTLALLDAVLTRAGRQLERAQAWEEAAREAPAPRRAERLLRAAELYGSLSRPDQAAACLQRVAAIPGENLQAPRLRAASALAAAHREAGRWRELAEALGRLAGEVTGKQRARVLAEQAEVLAGRLSARSEAWEAYRQLLALEPDHALAIGFAQRHLEESNQPQELSRVLSTAAAAASAPVRAATLWRLVARLA